METARESGAHTIVLTNFRDSRIARYADLLLCSSNEQLLYGDAIFSRTAQIAIVDMLYWGVILSDYDRYAAVLDRSSQIICDKAYTRRRNAEKAINGTGCYDVVKLQKDSLFLVVQTFTKPFSFCDGNRARPLAIMAVQNARDMKTDKILV